MKTLYYFQKINLFRFGLMLVLALSVNSNILAQPTLIGMTSQGGEGVGTLFSIEPGATALTTQIDFPVLNPGTYPRGLVETSSGKLFGTSMFGGAYGFGVLFEYNIEKNIYIKKVDFDGAALGKNPAGSLILSENGKLYGMTSEGGVNNLGVIFEYDIVSGKCVKKMDFDGASKGAKPFSSFARASNGLYYATTSEGGANNNGVLFQYNPVTNLFEKRMDFNVSSSGDYPAGKLVEASLDKLYGMTAKGGKFGKGSLYEYDILTGDCTTKVDFDGANGRNPFNNSLLKVDGGKLYGITATGGVNDLGVLFEYDPVLNAYSKKMDFGSASFGATPIGGLIKAVNGKLYGATVGGGAYGFGLMFEYDIDNKLFSKKIDFSASGGVMDRGVLLMQASNGMLYGITSYGGVSNNGQLFEYNISKSAYTKKIDLMDKSEGATPYGGLVSASNGMLYGATNQGGKNGKGAIIEYDILKNVFIKKADFDGAGNGANPYGSMVEAENGKLFGLTPFGGSDGVGVLYEYDPVSNILVKKINFKGDAYGKKPYGSLIFASNGKLYGMTSGGGDHNMGVLFEYDPNTQIYNKKFDFDGVNGSTPRGSLIEVNKKLYGLTSSGGSNYFGVLFEFDLMSGILTKKADFNGSITGRYPYGDLVLAPNARLYGMTYEGGANNVGVLFEYDPKANLLSKKIDFNISDGSSPRGSLVSASTGMLYGMTDFGGAQNKGTLFEYNPKTNFLEKKLDFNVVNGANPSYSRLIEVVMATSIAAKEIVAEAISIYPNPTSDQVMINVDKAGGKLSVFNSQGQIVTQQIIATGSTTVDLRKYPAGVYYVYLQQSDGIRTATIIKR